MSNIAAGLKANMQKATGKAEIATEPTIKAKISPKTVLIGSHYSPEVRKVLKLLEAYQNKPLKELLGEAINDLCAKYGQPQPYTSEE